MFKNTANRRKSFEAMFRKNYEPLFYRALDWVDDEEIAKDLVSELFADVWAKFDEIREDEAFSYLKRSLRNRCINYLQHLVVERKYQEYHLKMKEEAIDESDDLHERRLEIIGEVLDTLAPQRRFIFEQCVLEGKTYKEVAEIVNLQVSSVHKHVSKVYSLLRGVMSAEKKVD